jgi:hypothetical protein
LAAVSRQNQQPEKEQFMKPISTLFTCLGVIALLALATGCASPKQTENLLTLAGFKPVIASTAKQQQQLKSLRPDKVSLIQRKGKSYYVFPDVAHDRAWVGTPKQYQDYQQIRSDYNLSNENLAAAREGEDIAAGNYNFDGWEDAVWGD